MLHAKELSNFLIILYKFTIGQEVPRYYFVNINLRLEYLYYINFG